jgi:DNA-binding MarR family transcriptional regulator
MTKRTVQDNSFRPFVQIDAELIKGLTPYEFMAYAQIKRKAGNPNGECWQSLEHMSEESGIKLTTLKKALKGLKAKGLIKADQNAKRKTKTYILTPPDEWNLEAVSRPSSELKSRLATTYQVASRLFNKSPRDHNIYSYDLDPGKEISEGPQKQISEFESTEIAPAWDSPNFSETSDHPQADQLGLGKQTALSTFSKKAQTQQTGSVIPKREKFSSVEKYEYSTRLKAVKARYRLNTHSSDEDSFHQGFLDSLIKSVSQVRDRYDAIAWVLSREKPFSEKVQELELRVRQWRQGTKAGSNYDREAVARTLMAAGLA